VFALGLHLIPQAARFEGDVGERAHGRGRCLRQVLESLRLVGHDVQGEAEVRGPVENSYQLGSHSGADVVAAVVDQVIALQPNREPMGRARSVAELAAVLLRQAREAIGIVAVHREQLLRPPHAEPVGGRVVALHLHLDGIIELPIPDRVGGKKHTRHGHLIFGNSARAPRQIEHFRDAAFAAMVGEDGPVAAAEFPLHIGQIHGRSGNGALGR